MSKPMGRPKKVTSQEKLAIVHRYYIECTEETAESMQAHGIYKKLSEYAKSTGYSLEPHDFSRDEAVRNYIRHLNSIVDQEDTGNVIPTYDPLDIPALMTRSSKEIAAILFKREQYFEQLHKRAARSIEQYALLDQRCAHLQSEVRTLKSRNDALEKENNALEQQLRDSKKDVAYLARVIRKDVEPDRAHQYFQKLTSPDAALEVSRAFVTQSIRSLTREDRQPQSEAADDADKLDLKNLLKLI